METRRTRRASHSVLILVALFGIITVFGSRADASCGDYLSQHRMVVSDHFPMSGSDRPDDEIPRRAPCAGLSCQQEPMQFPPATPIVSNVFQDRWAWMETSAMPMLNQMSYLAHFDELVTLPMTTFRLDRPPKA